MPSPLDPHRGQPVLTFGAPIAGARVAMIMVHGRGASAEDMAGLAAELRTTEIACLAPQAAGRTWYPYSFLSPIEENEPGITSGLNVIAGLIDQLVAQQVPHERIALLGFSQGACLALEFAARRPRRYQAIVCGVPDSASGLIDAPLGRSVRDRTRMTVTVQGREARTRYEVVDAFARPLPSALVTCDLETGRTHQIRVHLAAIGHPVLGDARYHGHRGELVVGRPMLHAASLSFEHPTTGEVMTFDAPLPADFVAVLNELSPAEPA